MGSGGVHAVALALLRSWRRNLLRSLSALSAIVIGAALITLVAALSLSIVRSLGQASGLEVVDADLVVVARAPGGLPDATVGELAAAGDVDHAVPAVIASTRVEGTGSEGNLTVVGLPPEAAELAPGLAPPQAVSPQPGTAGLVTTADWSRRTGRDVGDVVDVATPAGGSAWTVVATDADAAGAGTLAVGRLAEVRDAFGRSRGVDVVFVDAAPGADLDGLTADLAGVAGPRATVGPPSEAVATVVSSYGIVRAVLFSVAGVGVMVGIAVVYICWRLQLLHDRRTLAQLRLVGARSRQLAGGAVVVFAAATTLALGLGIPLGLAWSRWLAGFSVRLASMTGYAVAPEAAPWPTPAMAGIAGGVVMGAVAWVVALRPLLRVPAIEALVTREAAGERLGPRPLIHLVLGIVAIGVAGVLQATLPVAWQPAVLVVILVAAILLARSVPASVGRLLSRRDELPFRLSGRHYQLAVRQTAATTTILVVALTFAIGLAGLTGGTARGIEASVDAWTGGDLYVEAGEPGSMVRDQRLAPALAGRLRAVDGVAAVNGVAVNEIDLGGRLVPIYSWNPDPGEQEGFVDLQVTAGVRGDGLWDALRRGDVAVTENFAWQHDLSLHDPLPLPTPDGVIRPRIQALVSDFLSDSGIVYTSIDVVEQLGGDPGLAAVGLRFGAGADPAAVTRAVERVVAEDQPGALVWSDEELRNHMRHLARQLISTLKMLSWATELLAIIVACTTIATTVASRRREYGLLGLCGAAPRLVRRQLRAEFVGLGLLSWIVAVGLGALVVGPLGATLERFSGLRPPFVLPALDVGIALLVALAGSVVAAWVPTRSMPRQPVISLIAVGE